MEANISMDSSLTDFNFTDWSSLRSNVTQSDSFKQTVDFLNIYFTPLVIIFGIMGNTMSLFVFSLTHLQRLSSSFYLCSLALADIGYLLGLSVVWMERVGVHLYYSEGWCQCVQYLMSFSGFVAVWNVLSFTAERYIVVYHPLRKDSFCTKEKARIVVLCVCIFGLIFYSIAVWTHGLVRYAGVTRCIPLFNNIHTVFTSLDTLCACIIPSIIIAILNVRIMVKIHHFQKRMLQLPTHLMVFAEDKHRNRSMLETSISSMGSMHVKFSTTRKCEIPGRNSQIEYATTNDISRKIRKKVLRDGSQLRTARMLLVLSSIFVLLNLPMYVLRIEAFVPYISGGSYKIGRARGAWNQLFNIIYFLNFAINFCIYSVCGRQFRTGLVRLCRKWQYNCEKFISIARHESTKDGNGNRDYPMVGTNPP